MADNPPSGADKNDAKRDVKQPATEVPRNVIKTDEQRDHADREAHIPAHPSNTAGFWRRLRARFAPPRESPKWTDIAIVILTLGLVVVGYWQYKDMEATGEQTDKLIGAANQIEDHQKKLVADNEQGLLDNRNALKASLEENRKELAKALSQNRDALRAQTDAANSELAAV